MTATQDPATSVVGEEPAVDPVEVNLISRVDGLLSSCDPRTTPRGDFLNARFDAGLAAVFLPIGLGGLALPRRYQGVVDKRLREAAAPEIDTRRSALGLVNILPALLKYATDEQKQTLVRPLWTGEDVWCQLFSEPGAGSDLAGVSTTAVRDGDVWVVNGQKVWTSSAHLAHWGLLIARTNPDMPKHSGLTFFFIDMASPGVEVRALRELTGEAQFNEVFLTDVRVPDLQRIGLEGNGWRAMGYLLNEERISVGGEMRPGREFGVVGSVADTWRRKPSAGTEDMHDALMRAWVESETTRLTSSRYRQQMERSGSIGPEVGGMKVVFARTNQAVTSLGLELEGEGGLRYDDWEMTRPEGTSMVKRNAIYRYLRAKHNSIEGGTTEIVLNVISERVLGLPREARGDKDIPWKELPR